MQERRCHGERLLVELEPAGVGGGGCGAGRARTESHEGSGSALPIESEVLSAHVGQWRPHYVLDADDLRRGRAGERRCSRVVYDWWGTIVQCNGGYRPVGSSRCRGHLVHRGAQQRSRLRVSGPERTLKNGRRGQDVDGRPRVETADRDHCVPIRRDPARHHRLQ